jgi:hypothetical protein
MEAVKAKVMSSPRFLVLHTSTPAEALGARKVPLEVNIRRKRDKWVYKLNLMYQRGEDRVCNVYSIRQGSFYRFNCDESTRLQVQDVLACKPELLLYERHME